MKAIPVEFLMQANVVRLLKWQKDGHYMLLDAP